MKKELVYLKPNVVIEPLIDGWYAWSHLVSPATAAMNIEHRHLKIMNSFIRSPEGHRLAVANPKLKGGPFMDIDPAKVEEVRLLRDETMDKREKMIAFSQAIRELSQMLRQEAKGYSLQPLYARVPAPLR